MVGMMKHIKLTNSEKRIRARASLRRIKLSICLGVAVITCHNRQEYKYDLRKKFEKSNLHN